MKKTLALFYILICSFISFAQTVVDFEALQVPASGYFNGSTQYTGNGSTQTINYSDNGLNLFVNYTDAGSYDYWSGFAYSNQTDLTTASYTNYSAYSPNGGGANNSSNYVIAYSYSGDQILFDNTVSISSLDITNAVWTYHYMNGSDGSEIGTFEAGDFFKITITGILADGTDGNNVTFYLADFTNGNSYIIDDWTTVDLSSLGEIKGLKFQLSSSDSQNPTYFCMDNISYNQTASIALNTVNNITIFPNPSTDFITISDCTDAEITIYTINGKMVFNQKNYNSTTRINLNQLTNGFYTVIVKSNNTLFNPKKLLINR